jgi:branched-subunit amino acid aminotransferase/4-amino-4-deoxychorismate lyase
MTGASEGLHAWTTAGWTRVDWCDPHEGRLLVADSWRVREGLARGIDRHRDRFLTSVAGRHPEAEAAADAALALLPRTGDWFPRLELRERADGTALLLRLRPTPPTATEVVVATAPHDPRTAPLVKGPDLDALLQLRGAVQPLGAGEAVIVDAPGRVVEGAYSGLLWWRGETLVQPAAALPRIPSVTVSLVLDAARAEGVPIASEEVAPAALAGCELWVLSALHGLRAATAWVDGPVLAPPAQADRGRRWLAAAERQMYPERGTPLLGG